MIRKELIRRQEEGRPIRVGVSGSGWMGSGFLVQVGYVPGMEAPIVVDEDLGAARAAFQASGFGDDQMVEATAVGPAADAIRSGLRVITGDHSLPAQLEEVDIVADVTASPAVGAKTAYACIEHGKDVVLVNIEADVTVGRILKRKAEEAGVLYSVSSGDEPGCLMELYDFVVSLGYEPIVIGKGKNNPLNPSANPETVKEAASKADKDPYQVASYVDGTKTMFEMACAANATGSKPMKRGMVGPEASLDDVSEIFALQSDGGLTEFPGAVDFVQGQSMAGGVFVTVRVRDRRLQADLEYLKVGRGEYYTFFRPYHLWFLEAPISIARAHLWGERWLVPRDEPAAEVMTVAKKDLSPGDRLDAFGGYTFHGVIETFQAAADLDALPVGLAPGAEITRPVEKGRVIEWGDVDLDENSLLVRLRREQDAVDRG